MTITSPVPSPHHEHSPAKPNSAERPDSTGPTGAPARPPSRPATEKQSATFGRFRGIRVRNVVEDMATTTRSTLTTTRTVATATFDV